MCMLLFLQFSTAKPQSAFPKLKTKPRSFDLTLSLLLKALHRPANKTSGWLDGVCPLGDVSGQGSAAREAWGFDEVVCLRVGTPQNGQKWSCDTETAKLSGISTGNLFWDLEGGLLNLPLWKELLVISLRGYQCPGPNTPSALGLLIS